MVRGRVDAVVQRDRTLREAAERDRRRGVHADATNPGYLRADARPAGEHHVRAPLGQQGGSGSTDGTGSDNDVTI
jgi:hypothetical protein